MTELGYNYRMTDIQAALGESQLKRLDSFIKKRKQIVSWYKKELSSVKEIVLPEELNDIYSGWHLYIIRTKESADRDKLTKYLKKNGVGVNFHYPAVYSHPYYRKNGFKNTKFKNTELYQNTCVTLPLHTKLTKKDVVYISNKIKEFYE
jgi:dTDP-4-amino-4,6-dideoxygalactose transaminase